MKPKIISMINKKGGVSKTTTAISLSYTLTLEDFGSNKVLLIDFDSQYNATMGLGFSYEKTKKHEEEETGLYEVIMKTKPIENMIYSTKYENLDLVPANSILNKAKKHLSTEYDQNVRLKKVLEKSEDFLEQYDYIIIDTNPSLELLEINVLVASDYIVIPVVAAKWSYMGINTMVSSLIEVKNDLNADLNILGILLTQVDYTSKKVKKYRKKYGNIKDGILFDTEINMNVAADWAAEEDIPLYLYDKKSKASQKYYDFTKELLERINKIEGGKKNG